MTDNQLKPTQADMEALPKDLLWSIPVGYHKAIFAAFARYREKVEQETLSREQSELRALLAKCRPFLDERYFPGTGPSLQREINAALGIPDGCAILEDFTVDTREQSRDGGQLEAAVLDLPFANIAPIEWGDYEWGLLADTLSAPPASPEQPSPSPVTGEAVDLLGLVAGYVDYKAISEDRWEQGKAAGYRELAELVAAALTTYQSQTERLREAETSWFNLTWIAPPSEPLADGRRVHPEPMTGKMGFDSFDKAIAFFRKRVKGSEFVSLIEVGTRKYDRTDEALAALSETRP